MNKDNYMKYILILMILSVLVISGCGTQEISEPDSIYVKEITRIYNNQEDKELILRAESLECPYGRQWWFNEFDNIKILNCLNNEAVNYYSNLVDNIESNPSYTGFDIKIANLTYNAEVLRQINNGEYNCAEENQNVIIVKLTLDFHEYCGPVCGLYLSHYRTVVMDDQKEILCILGDDERSTFAVS